MAKNQNYSNKLTQIPYIICKKDFCNCGKVDYYSKDYIDLIRSNVAYRNNAIVWDDLEKYYDGKINFNDIWTSLNGEHHEIICVNEVFPYYITTQRSIQWFDILIKLGLFECKKIYIKEYYEWASRRCYRPDVLEKMMLNDPNEWDDHTTRSRLSDDSLFASIKMKLQILKCS